MTRISGKRHAIRTMMLTMLTMLAAMSTTACGGDSTGPTLRKDVMWNLSVFPTATSVSVSETLPLRVSPLDFDGNLIDSNVRVTYVSSDTTRVVVDSAGTIRGVRSTSGNGVQITITVQAGPVTKTVWTQVGVTATPVDVASIAVLPLGGDPIVPIGGMGVFSVKAFDSHGGEVSNVYTQVDMVAPPGISGQPFWPLGSTLLAMYPGKAWVRATVFVNGKLLRDSVEYKTRWRDYVDLTISRNPTGGLSTLFVAQYTGNVYISPNAQVDFINKLTTPIDVIFEQPDAAKGSLAGAVGGNIMAIAPGKRAARWFPEVGDYFFTIQSGTESRRISVSVKE